MVKHFQNNSLRTSDYSKNDGFIVILLYNICYSTWNPPSVIVSESERQMNLKKRNHPRNSTFLIFDGLLVSQTYCATFQRYSANLQFLLHLLFQLNNIIVMP